MPSILITGSNRGLGLEWARQYAKLGWHVYATCRYPEQADDLQQLSQQYNNLSLHQLDITKPDQVARIAQDLVNTKLDLLVNNAGVYYERWGKDKLGIIDYNAWLETFNVNTLGAIRVTEALRDNLAQGVKRLVVAITSHMGSIEDTKSPNDYAYRSSKAALNMVIKGLAHELADYGIGVLLFHPGWVRTRMGGSDAPLSPEESVTGMRTLVDKFQLQESGNFYRYDGVSIPW